MIFYDALLIILEERVVSFVRSKVVVVDIEAYISYLILLDMKSGPKVSELQLKSNSAVCDV
mgnify:CR=1 FL=1